MTLLDKLIARWEVSRAAPVPLAFTSLSSPPMLLLTWALALFGHSRATGVSASILFTVWLSMAATDGIRGLWAFRHPYASRRWLRSVNAVVGDDVMLQAYGWLGQRFGHEPDYRIKRSDVAIAVQIEREKRREDARRAEGLRLIEEPVPVPVRS